MPGFGPLNIGDVRIAHPFVQAALSGYSDLAMRRLARAHGASYTINEVVLGQSVLHASDWQRQLLDVAPDDHPVGAQLMGADPRHFGPAARMLADAGYDVIDINFGCPVPKAIDGCRGGYLLGQPEQALQIVRSVWEAVGHDRPVTVKMRRGVDDSPESRRRFFTILDEVFALGISAVTVHGRTVAQKYRGPSNWRFLADVKRHVGDRVILGSGDLFHAEDCVRMMTETGVDGVTIARGALGNPWIFRQCLALAEGTPCPDVPPVREQGLTIRRHLELADEIHRPERSARLVAKFGMRYSRFHPHPKRVRAAFAEVATSADLLALLEEHY